MIQFFLQYYGKTSGPGPLATQADNTQQQQQPTDSSGKPPGKLSGLGSMFRKMVSKKKDQKADSDAAGSLEGGGDLNGQASGVYSEGSYNASQGTLQNGSDLGAKKGDEGQLERERNVDSEMVVVSSSSEEIGGIRGKKKKHRKHKKKSDGSSPPPVGKDDLNYALAQSASGNPDDAGALQASPTGSQDEVGDKLAADARPKPGDKDKKHFPGLCFKKGTCYK